VIEPNGESYEPGREPDSEEQEWFRTERDEQEWLRAQQEIFLQQVRNIAADTCHLVPSGSAGGRPWIA
jgi:hypothetical protein